MKEEEVAICVAKERVNIDAIKKNLKKIVRNNYVCMYYNCHN